METTLQYQDRLHYAEVYASDILELKNIFLQQLSLSKINKKFGIPFLLVRKGNKIVAFASLILTQDNQIDFEIHGKFDLRINEREDFMSKAKDYCARNTSDNFINPDELQYNIQRMVDWLNN